MKIKLLIFSFLCSVLGWGQISIPSVTPVTENFNSMGTSATAALPSGVRVNTIPNYTTGTSVTTVSAGSTGTGVINSGSTGGVYNYANGITASATDRALGFLTSGSFSSPRTIIVAIQNTGTSTITDLSISFDYEKYRSGTRAFNWTFFHGSTATNVNTAATTGDQAYAADANNTTVSNPPASINKSVSLTGLNIAPSALYYLCWTYTGVGGATNAQGIGLDNLSLTATFSAGCTGPTTQASAVSTSNPTLNGFDVNWTQGNGNGTMVVIRDNSLANALPVSGTSYTANLDWALAGQIDTNNRVVFRGSGSSAAPITGLNPGTEYRVTAYEYNTAGDCYNIAATGTNVGYTMAQEPGGHAGSFTCNSFSSTQIDLTFSAANTIANSKAYIILQKIGSVPTGLPTDGVFYPAGTVIGDATVAGYTSLAGTDTSFSATGLTPNTTYYFTLIPLNSYLSVAQTMNYRVAATIPSTNCTTPVTPCHTETFSGIANATGYGSRSWTGTGGTWTATDAREDQTITGKAITIRNGVLTSPTFNDGVGNISLTVKFPFGETSGNLDVKVNGVTIGTILFSQMNGTTPVTKTFTGINIGGNVVISASSSVARYCIDDLNWTCYTPPPAPNIEVTGNAIVVANGDITPSVSDATDFGNGVVSSPSSHSFLISNTGNADLTISSVTFVGGNASDFAVSTNPSGTITSGLDGFLGITFTPSATGIRTTSVQIANNVAGKSPYTFTIQGNGLCTAGIVSSVSPNNGPVNTRVTVTISSGDLTGSTATFNGIPATVVSNTATQLVLTVPAGATTGNLVITSGSGCKLSMPFTVITQDNTSCEGNSTIADLFISEVTDSSSGSLSYIEIYNATGSTVNLSNYEVRIRNNGAATGDDIPLTGILSNGDSFTLATSVGSACSVPGGNGNLADQHNVSSGVNNNDCIHLNKNGVDIDIWGVCDGSNWITTAGLGAAGYDFERKNNITVPSAVFNTNDWVIADFDLCNDNYSNVATYGGMTPTTPVINVQPSINLTCTSVGAVVSVTASEGFAGGNPLAYQWYVVPVGSTAWTALTNTGVYNGTTTNTLTISAIAGLYGYQYYCQVRENNATCYMASNAAVLEDTSSTTWNGTAWSNGTPAIGKLAFINGNYNTTTHGDIDACSLIVNAGFTATVTAGHYINIENDLTVNGTLDILNNGSLIQVSDTGVNTGNIAMKRTATIRLLDYVYWSSPVAGFSVASISPGTSFSKIWKWQPTVVNPNGGFGNWQNANETMGIGKGYIVRGPNGFNATPQAFTANFTGVPNNGIKNVAIERGNFTGADYPGTNGSIITKNDDNWNLIGNPYPSAISAVDFLTLNANIEGSVRVWTHGTLPSNVASNPFYNSYAYNYAASDYIIYNATGPSTQNGFDGYIGAGQSFFVLMNDGPATTETVTFQNALRNKGHRNDQFFRNANLQNTANSIERHRIWIDLVSATGNVNRALIGYVEGATQNKDRLYDAYSDRRSAQDFYSIVNNEPLAIQGRALPFTAEDLVPMGVKLPTNGTYTIALASVDGLFSNNAQAIYLEDKALNVIHNLNNAPYQFTASQGIINNRFVLRYTDAALGNHDFDTAESNVAISTLNNDIKVSSSLENIKELIVYNVLGQVLASKKNVNGKLAVVNSISRNQEALIVKTVLENGQSVTKKIIF
ncbi:choice-of-anchor D domain-containing protein [Flavobacterium humi]|uniref:Lamin tail domain-containing protein n=1 Tax=Flavobacterium humi TaxID=2562683 RepID=A0A4Z0L8U8_9FLAO|nr:choice-of-anchor D domain-containing protein [Flavobacterium humi]TGD57584.1 lamin tail domain-containing protein [Flavobacterium humi]